MKHFCTCPVTPCPRHPCNHNQGCDPCIKDNLEKGKMPACMFQAVDSDVSDVKDYTLKGFVDFYLRIKKDKTSVNLMKEQGNATMICSTKTNVRTGETR